MKIIKIVTDYNGEDFRHDVKTMMIVDDTRANTLLRVLNTGELFHFNYAAPYDAELYAPISEKLAKQIEEFYNDEILVLEFEHEYLGTTTIKQWFESLLTQLWEQKESFSGKRPLGNSGWDHDIAAVLIANNHIPGKLDDDGFVSEMDEAAFDKLIHRLICHIFK